MEEYENEELETEEIDLTSPIDKALAELEPTYKTIAEIKMNIDNLNAILQCSFISDDMKIEIINNMIKETDKMIEIKKHEEQVEV